MKIALPLKGKSMTEPISPTFGRSNYFVIYDTESGEIEFVANDISRSQENVGIRTSQLLIAKKVDVVILPQCGENAANILKAVNIRIFQSANESVGDNILALQSGELSSLTEIHKGFYSRD